MYWQQTWAYQVGYDRNDGTVPTKEIQEINNKRREAIENGMTMEEAMKTYK